MKFCPECGAPIAPAAKFCVNCGPPLDAAPVAVKAPRAPIRIPAGFATVFLGVLVAGLVVGAILVRQQRKVQAQEESAPAANLPPAQPQVELPARAVEFIKNLESRAQAQPKDVEIWNRLGTVGLRASMFDPS